MPSKADVILGLQWGDEGKGRIVDLYAADYDVVARFGGGDNAGHSIVVGDRELALRIVPSGVMHPHVELFIGGGTVVNLATLMKEFDALTTIGVDISRVKISDRAHVVFPHHVERDKASEAARTTAIGTTGRGIGPAYVDRVARSGVRFADLLRAGDLDAATRAQAERVRPHVVDGVEYLHERLAQEKRVLIEGAQGSLLDVGYGTYPYVTSSHTIAGGACIGLGIGPAAIGRVIGVLKAYCTRVGGGPFPSELHDERGERLRQQGAEFGTVTGRPRRCGWLDIPMLRYSNQVNGTEWLVITKLDVLDTLEEIPVCIGYEIDGKATDEVPADVQGLERIKPKYTTLKGWRQSTEGITEFEKLPKAAQEYLRFQERESGARVGMISTGPDREQTMLLPEFAAALDSIHK